MSDGYLTRIAALGKKYNLNGEVIKMCGSQLIQAL